MRIQSWGGHELDETTPLYVDLHIALECLHLRYPEYMRVTTKQERLLYRLYLALKTAKERHVQEHIEMEREHARLAQEALPPGVRQ